MEPSCFNLLVNSSLDNIIIVNSESFSFAFVSMTVGGMGFIPECLLMMMMMMMIFCVI